MTDERYCVAGHCLRIQFGDGDGQTLLPNFENFRIASDDVRPDRFTVQVLTALNEWEEDTHEIGQFDCGGSNHAVMRRSDGGYQFAISNPSGVLCARIIADPLFQHVRVALASPEESDRRFGLNNCMMLSYSFALCEEDTLLVHASVIRNNGRGYLMTAPSGTGKSTHTYLWYKNIPGSDLMNDDNPVIRIVENTAKVYGSPWSGKTPCYRNIEAPIGAVVRIQRNSENVIRRLSPIEAFAMMLPSCNNMKWDRRVYTAVCSSLNHLVATAKLWELGCRPDREAALVCYEAVSKDN